METAVFVAELTRDLTRSELETLFSRLPAARRARLLRTLSRSRRREIICAYALLQFALRSLLDWSALPEIAKTSFGKPYFPAYPDVHFNISHTDGAVMVGISPRPIGVDIEKTHPVGRRVMRRVMGIGNAEAGNLTAFFRAWVAMESCGKRDGGGVLRILRDAPDALSDAGYSPLETFPDYFAGVAVSAGCTLGAVRLYTV